MPGSGTSWRASDLPTWEQGRTAIVTALNRLERDVAAILTELREAERREAGDEVRRQAAADDLARLRVLVERLEGTDLRQLRHRVAQLEHVQQAAAEAEERQDREEARTLRRRLLGALGLAGGGGGLALLGERLLDLLG